MVYLVNDNGNIRTFYSEDEMKKSGFKSAGLKVTEEDFNSSGCYSRLIDGKIVVGRTKEEIAAQEKQDKIAEHMAKLQQIDNDSGASRHVRDVSVSAGVVLDAVRVLLSRFAEELDIKLPAGFGAGASTATELLALAPASNASAKDKADFAVFKALLLVSHYDPSINPGLTKIKEAEIAANAVREELAPLLV